MSEPLDQDQPPDPDAADSRPPEADKPDLLKVAAQRAKQALRLASASVPHLSGLARLARIKPTTQVEVAAVAASGLVLVHPGLFANMPMADAAFILAHELMHLALDTHGRQGRANQLITNFAHDYVINDILSRELDRQPPLEGLYSEGASNKSLEEWIVDLSKIAGADQHMRCWTSDPSQGGEFPGLGLGPPPPSPMSRALEDAGLVPKQQPRSNQPSRDKRLSHGDLIPEDMESEFEPELSPQARQQIRERVRRAAAKAASLAELKDRIDKADATGSLVEPERGESMIRALQDAYHTPWELAMQRWMDAVAPGERTYSRPSRRAGDRSDVVLPGRRREGHTLHILLDTSGSMVDYLPRALGAISYFCEANNIAEVHVVQCDVEVTKNEWVETYKLGEYKVAGFGYSDMQPGMRHLADDPEVTAIMVLTDGYIDILSGPPPYAVLWVLLGQINGGFNPPYGQKVVLDRLR